MKWNYNIKKYIQEYDFSWKYFGVGLLIFPVVNYNVFFGGAENTSSDKNLSSNIFVIEKGNIENSIEVVWEASLVNEQSLQFNKAGTVTLVNFKGWDMVKKWETIAEIDSSDAYVSIEEARLSLDNTKIALSELYKWPDESNILQSQNSVTNAENVLEIAQKELENLQTTQLNALHKLEENMQTAQKEFAISEANLALSQKEFEIFKKEQEDSFQDTQISKSSTITDIEDDFKSYAIDIEKMIEESDYVLWITKTNEDKNDAYEPYLWVKNSWIKTQAEDALRKAITWYENLKTQLWEYDFSEEKEQITSLLQSYLWVFQSLYDAADFIYKTAENSVTSGSVFTDSDISSIKSTMSSYKSSALSKIGSIKSSIDNLQTLTDIDLVSEWNENTLASKEASLNSETLWVEKKKLEIQNLIKSYNETVENYKISLQSKQNDLVSKEKSLQIAKLNLEELLEWPTDTAVRKAQNNIKQAEIRLENAYKDLWDYMLQAPFDGVIRKIDYMPWDNLNNDTNKYVYIENPDLLEITVMLDQIDIVKVHMWDAAKITFDAYKDTPVLGQISLIDTTPTKTSWVVYYEVKIILNDPDFHEKVLSWMTANIEVITESKNNILLVKTSYIQDQNGKKMVTVERNGKQEDVEIETWASSWGMTEVVSWLEEWERVFEKQFTISSSSNSNTSWALFSVPSRWWGWSWRNFR